MLKLKRVAAGTRSRAAADFVDMASSDEAPGVSDVTKVRGAGAEVGEVGGGGVGGEGVEVGDVCVGGGG